MTPRWSTHIILDGDVQDVRTMHHSYLSVDRVANNKLKPDIVCLITHEKTDAHDEN